MTTYDLKKNASAPSGWLPWWYRPSWFLLGVSLPSLLILSFSDKTLTLSKAQLIYSNKDLLVGIAGIFLLAAGAMLGESRMLAGVLFPKSQLQRENQSGARIAEAFFSEKVDWFLMAVFVVSHLIFFRGFFINPGLITAVLGGNVELKHTFKTIPGVTTWTQVSLVLGAIRGLRWAGVLPGKIKLISLFHIVFFGTLFVRAVLWSERLALIEGGLPFVICAMPRITRSIPRSGRVLFRFLPLIVPVLLLVVFTAFETLRSWQYYSAQNASLLEFGWRRLFTYYFEAMNTGAATLTVSGFYQHVTLPISNHAYEAIYEGLYLGTLDKEYNNTSGIWYVGTKLGNIIFAPFMVMLGAFFGTTWRAFVHGKLYCLFYPIVFLSLMEIIRIPYWIGTNRVMPATVVILVILAWAITVPFRVRSRSLPFTAGEPASSLS